MKLFLDYLNKIKFHILLMIFPTIFTGIIFFLYQLAFGRTYRMYDWLQ